MVSKKISDLPSGTAPAGTELIPAVQGGANVSITPAQLKTLVFNALPGTLGVAQRPSNVTASTVSVANDPSLYYKMNSSSAQTITLPAGLSLWVEGMVLTIVQLGAGLVTVAAATNVTIVKSSSTLNSKGQYNAIQLLNIGTDNWMILGGTA